MAGEGTGKVPKRFKTPVKRDLYSSEGGKVVKRYLEESEVLDDWANETLGTNDLGAKTVEVVGPGHEGGTFRDEPFHLDIRVKNGGGSVIPTTNPRTGRKTNTRHAYIAENNEDLYNKAREWDDAQKKSSSVVDAKAERVVDDKKIRVGGGGGGSDGDDSRTRAAAPNMEDQSTKDDPGDAAKPTPALPDDEGFRPPSFDLPSLWAFFCSYLFI